MPILDVFLTAIGTTATVILVALSGAVIVGRMTDGGRAALKGFVYITALITLPCLLFTRLALGFDEALLSESWPLLVFGAGQISFGITAALLSDRLGFVTSEYAPLVTLALASQNAVAFPYALLRALHSVWWWDGAGVLNHEAQAALAAKSLKYGETLLFVFNICTSLTLWSFGNQTVARAAARRRRALSGETQEEDAGEARSLEERVKHFLVHVVKPAFSVPVIASVLGIAVGLIGPLRWLVRDAPVARTVTRGLAAAGDACIPLTLILLGCSLAVQRREQRVKAAELNAATAAASATPGAASSRAPETPSDTRGTPSSRPLDMVPIEHNPSFRLPPAGRETGDAEAAISDEAPLAVASIRGELTPTLRQGSGSRSNTAAASFSTSGEHRSRAGEDAAQGGGDKHGSVQLSKLSTWPDQWRFAAYVATVRFICMPTLGFLSLWALGAFSSLSDSAPRNGDDVDRRRVMFIVMVFQSFSPPAVNGGVICTLHGYFPDRHGLMLAVLYLLTAAPAVIWVSAGLAVLS